MTMNTMGRMEERARVNSKTRCRPQGRKGKMRCDKLVEGGKKGKEEQSVKKETQENEGNSWKEERRDGRTNAKKERERKGIAVMWTNTVGGKGVEGGREIRAKTKVK